MSEEGQERRVVSIRPDRPQDEATQTAVKEFERAGWTVVLKAPEVNQAMELSPARCDRFEFDVDLDMKHTKEGKLALACSLAGSGEVIVNAAFEGCN